MQGPGERLLLITNEGALAQRVAFLARHAFGGDSRLETAPPATPSGSLSDRDWSAVLVDADAEPGWPRLATEMPEGRRAPPLLLLASAPDDAFVIDALGTGAMDVLAKDELTAPLLRHAVRRAVLDATARQALPPAAHDPEALAREAAANPAAVCDRNGVIVWANAAFARLTGYGVEEIRGLPMKALKSGKQDRFFYENLWSTVLSGKVWHGELVNRRKDGTLYDEEMTVTPVCDAKGRVSHFIAVKEDVGERKRTLQLLLQNEDRYRTVVETTGETFAIVDENGLFHFMNGVAAARLGGTPSDFLGRTMWDLFPAEIADRHMDSIRRVIRNRARETVEAPSDILGQARWYRTTIEPIRGSPGGPARAVVFAVDITDRKQVEDELRKFKTITDRACYGAVITDRDGLMTYVNEAWARMHGYAIGDLLGEHVSLLHTDEQMARMTELIERLRGTAGFTAEEVWHKRKDGSVFPTLMNATVIRDEAGRLALLPATAVDVSERRRAEKELAEQRMKTIAAARLAALGVMAGGIAHEINNPLMVIAGTGEQLQAMLPENLPNRAAVVIALDRIRRNIDRIERIIRGLRTLASERPGESFSRGFLDDVIGDTVELCRARFSLRGVALHVQPVHGVIPVECRPTQISQVLLNLLANALDAAEASKEKWVRIDVAALPDHVEIGVTDSGSGVPEALRERVFEPFFTTKPPGKGTGLGLSISRAIVNDHGGELRLDPTLPDTRFVVRLPKRQAPGKPQEVSREHA